MKMDKETIIVMVVCVSLLLTWPFLFPSMRKKQEEARKNKAIMEKKLADQVEDAKSVSTDKPAHEIKSSEKSENSSVQDKKDVSDDSKLDAPKKDATVEPKELPPEKVEVKIDLPLQTINNDLMEVVINQVAGCIEEIRLKKYLDSDRKAEIALDKGSKPGALSVFSNVAWVALKVISCENSGDRLSLRREIRAGDRVFELIQTWSLEKEYRVKYTVALVNSLATNLTFKELLISAGAIPPLKQLCGDKVMRDRHNIDYCVKANDAVISVSAPTSEDAAKQMVKSQDNPVRWVGVSNKYFACLLLPEQPFEDGSVNSCVGIDMNKEGVPQAYAVGTSGNIGSFEVPAQGERVLTFSYYAGPKVLSLLENFDPRSSGIMRLFLWAWASWCEAISQWLLKALNILKNICGSYGWSIILLTVIVKALFWPITQKANSSMRKMQKLQPKMKELREKYQGNPAEMNKKVMELYKQEKANPLSGCLPILLQIPVFIALYSTLDGSIELRHTSFWWAADLSRPDSVGPAIFGFHLHPLVIAMTGLMVLQQKMTPAAADPMQQKMMMAMPIVMLFLLYDLPSGLTLYWTVSQLISIIQLMVNKKIAEKEEAEGPQAKAGA